MVRQVRHAPDSVVHFCVCRVQLHHPVVAPGKQDELLASGVPIQEAHEAVRDLHMEAQKERVLHDRYARIWRNDARADLVRGEFLHYAARKDEVGG